MDVYIRFYYIKKNGSNTRLLLLDIDSLTYEIKTEDFMEVLVRLKKFLILVIIQLSRDIMTIKKCLILVIIQQSQDSMTIKIN